MASTRTRRRRAVAAEGDDERWLLTYADMITLLMALFMVLFSISSVNTSKFESLQRSLEDAFSGKILPGGKGTTEAGGAEKTPNHPAMEPPIPAIKVSDMKSDAGQQSKAEDEDFQKLKTQLDSYARGHGLRKSIQTEVRSRGLVVRVLTDDLLFDSAQADVKPKGVALLAQVARLIEDDDHAVSVEGHTDDQPIATERYPSNWELSTARAAAVVRAFTADGLAERRFEAAGYAALHPIDDNDSPAARSRNRRVEIVLLRHGLGRQRGPVTP